MNDSRTFEIAFLQSSTGEVLRDEDGLALGQLLLGGEREMFASPTDYWSEDDYRTQWRAGLERILSRSSASSCLITSIESPNILSHLFWWLLYRDGDNVTFRQHLVVAGHRDPAFDDSHPYDAVPAYEERSEISEWRVPVRAIDEFLGS